MANGPDTAESGDDRRGGATDAGDSLAAVAAGVLDHETHLSAPTSPPAVGALGEVLGPDEPLSLRAATRAEGRATLIVAGGTWFIAVAEFVVLALLGPDLIDEFALGEHFAVYVLVAPALLFAAAQPIGNLVDRPETNRPRVLGVLLAVAAVSLAVAGLAGNRWVFFMACALSGLGLLASQPVFIGMLCDRYPLDARAVVLGAYSAFGCAAYLAAPLVVVVAGRDGDGACRLPFVLGGAATLVLAAVSLRLVDARRGRFEVEALFGDRRALVVEQTSFSHALARFGQIRTLRLMTLGVAALGFAFLSWGIFLNQYIDARFAVSGTQRAAALGVAAVPGLLALPATTRRVAAAVHHEPGRILVLAGVALLGFNLAIAGLWAPTFGLLMAGQAVGLLGVFAALGALPVIVQAVIPPQMRCQAGAVFSNSMFVGATAAALLLVDLGGTYGLRKSLTVLVPLATVVAFAMMRTAVRSVVPDMARVVAELREERAVTDAHRSGDPLPVLQVSGVDFSYGPVQVLFGVDLEIAEGETVALLGTNGAGKSTLLRVISGLELPSRGVVRHDGHAITYADPPTRVARGIVQLSGGRCVFPPLSVIENLRLGAYLCDRSEVNERVAEVLELFPALGECRDQAAGTLSGGQQQLLGLAKALVLRPHLLIIDELSLGLSPTIVGELLRLVQQLKDQGTTMLIVEQSVNVALALADRAVFMEKGEVRFEGPAADLLERDDLLRAVFLGAEGG